MDSSSLSSIVGVQVSLHYTVKVCARCIINPNGIASCATSLSYKAHFEIISLQIWKRLFVMKF